MFLTLWYSKCQFLRLLCLGKYSKKIKFLWVFRLFTYILKKKVILDIFKDLFNVYLFIFNFFFFFELESPSVAQAGVQWRPLTLCAFTWSCTPELLPNSHLGSSSFFVFLVEIRFHHVGHAGLEPLTSGNPPTSVSQSARVTGSIHRPQPLNLFLQRVGSILFL